MSYILFRYGVGVYYFNNKGEHHRENGPAVIEDPKCKFYKRLRMEWWINGQRHKEDGPAIEWYNGDKPWAYKGYLLNLKKNLNNG